MCAAQFPKPYAPCSKINTVIFGYYGRDNLGDETNLRELVTFLRELQPGIGITVISASPEATAQCFRVESTGKYDWAGIVKLFRKADLIIGGGGSLFQDRSSLRSLFYYSGLIFLARWCRLPVFLYGQGIGPLRSKIGKWLARWALAQVKVITVRDRISQSLMEELKVRGPAVHLTAEPLLIKERIPEAAVKLFWEGIAAGGKYKLGLVPVHIQQFNLRFWTRILDALYQKISEIYLLTTARDDWRLLRSLSKNFGIPILPVEYSWEKLLMAAGGLDLVISARLHGLVAAVVQGIPCYGLALDPKIEGFCLALGIDYCRLTAKTDPFSLSLAIINDIKQGSIGKETLKTLRNIGRREALQNQAILKKMLVSIRGWGNS